MATPRAFATCLVLAMTASQLKSTLGATQFKDGDKVMVYVNKAGPYENPHETYHYYQLPVCRPEKIIHKTLSLGEVLNGDRLAESLYDIKFLEEKKPAPLCDPIHVAGEDLHLLTIAVEENYMFEMNVDDITIRSMIGRLDEESVLPHKHKTFVYTHHAFVFQHNGEYIISASIDVQRDKPVQFTQTFSLQYTYSVEWHKVDYTLEDRQKLFDQRTTKPKNTEVHWLSILNSTLLVVLLMALVVLILVRVVRNDLVRYNEPMSDAEKEDHLDNGWKVINGDVFRFPRFPSLFCAILGVGTQLLVIVGIILVVAALDVINVHRHGFINAFFVLLYAFTSCVAGYVSARYYRMMNGQQWILNINITTTLFSMPMFITWVIENSFFWGYHSTQALPFGTVALLFAIWIFVGYPLTVIGGVLGKNFASRYDAPCRTRTIPREVPELPVYHSCPVYCVVGGFLPFSIFGGAWQTFNSMKNALHELRMRRTPLTIARHISAISVELYYIFATIWGHESYTLYGVLLVVFLIVGSVTACVAVALTYFQLASEDYHWWWRAVFVGGSVGFFVYLYAVFFYFYRSQMSGILQTVQYFGYAAVIAYAFFLAMGTVAFFAAQRFVKYIYVNVKTD